MHLVKLFFTGALFLLGASLFAHEEAMFLVEMAASGTKERSEIAKLIHIDKVVNDRIYAVVNAHDLASLQISQSSALLSIEVLKEEDQNRADVGAYFDYDFPIGEEKFHTYDEMYEVLLDLSQEFPHLVQLFSIGTSIQGRELWALRISDETEIDLDEVKPAIVYMGTHHAREHLSTEIPLLFVEKLLSDSLTDLEIQDLLKQIEIYVIPMVNPDGALHDIESRDYKWWRKNRRRNQGGSYGVDLNRNYSFGWGTGGSSTNPRSDVYMGRAPFSEPETKAIKDFFYNKPNIKVALSVHTFSELILYPWGGREEGIGGADEAIFKQMASDMAKMNHYRPMQSSELYIASGDTCDWAYGVFKIFCFTFELSPSSVADGGFYPGASVIEYVFDDNWEPLLYLAKFTHNPHSAIQR